MRASTEFLLRQAAPTTQLPQDLAEYCCLTWFHHHLTRLEHIMPCFIERAPGGSATILHDVVEVVTQLIAIFGDILERRAKQALQQMRGAHIATAIVVGMDPGCVADRRTPRGGCPSSIICGSCGAG